MSGNLASDSLRLSSAKYPRCFGLASSASFNLRRHFSRKIDLKKVSDTTKTKPDTMEDSFYKLYTETAPNITSFTMAFGVFSYSMHSVANLDIANKRNRSIFFENLITGATLGFFIGMTYAIRFPLIAINNVLNNS